FVSARRPSRDRTDAERIPHLGGVLMKRVAIALLTIFAGTAGSAAAQATGAGDHRAYVGFTAAATLGNKSSSSLGGEAGVRLGGGWVIFGEAGRMGNVATDAIEAKAQNIANNIGATSNVVVKATYFDAGLKYVTPPAGILHPYVAI